MSSVAPAASAAQIQRYRIEAGTGSNVVVGQVDTKPDSRIVAAPPIWRKFIGQPLYNLEWWLAAKYRSFRRHRIPDFEYPGRERALWVQALADVILPQHCACGQLLERTGDLETHMERGCWRAA